MKCTTPGCPRQIECPSVQKCRACYAYFRYWYKKNSPAAIRARKAQIGVWTNRLDEMLKVKTVVSRRKRGVT